jgi:hypothetical protein
MLYLKIFSMLIGYSVLYVNDDMIPKDSFWNKRVVYSSWERALEVSQIRAEEEMRKYDDPSIISLIKSKSKEACEKIGEAHIFIINNKTYNESGNIYIVPVYFE